MNILGLISQLIGIKTLRLTNPNLDTGGNGRAIRSNWGVNCASWKFGGGIEKVVIVEGGKV